MKKKILLVALFSLQLMNSQTLDPSFGTNGGIVTNTLTNIPSSDFCGDAVLQTDGKIVFVGRNPNENYSFIARTNPSGSLDTSFNNFGFITFSGTGFDSLLVQPDGKIVVVGQSIVYRFNSNGTLDTSFNSTGSVIIGINSYPFYGKSILLQNDGKIVVVGTVNNSSNNDYAVIRLNTNGSFDSTFDFDGKTTIAIGTGNDEAFSEAIQSDGKIVVVGQTNNGSNYDIGTIRLNSNGSLDTSFAINGIAILAFTTQDYGRTVDIQTDGKILVAGVANGKLTVARYFPNGMLDTTFDNDGILTTTTSFSNSTAIISTTINKPKIKFISATGKILISGQSGGNFCLVQLNSNGSFDTTFGGNSTGINTQDINLADASCFLLIRPDGKILTGGSSYIALDSTVSQLVFSNNGVFESVNTSNLYQGSDKLNKTIEQSSGKTVSLINGGLLVRYNTNGTIDTTFGVNGRVDIAANSIFKMKQINDQIILSDQDFPQLTKYTSDGVLDTTFGTNGFLDLSPNWSTVVSFIDDIKPLSNGKLLIGFDYDETIGGGGTGNYSYGLLLLNSDGTIDTTFGVNGITKTRFDYYGNTSNEFPSEISIQSDGKIVVAGFLNTTTSGFSDWATGLARFNANGTVDSSFGTNGNTVVHIGTKNFPLNLITLPDNKLLLNINGVNTNNIQNTLTIKFDANGLYDNSFGTNGVLIDAIYGSDMLVQSDGKIIKAGSSNSQFAIIRYNTDSSIDTSFGNSGIISTPIYFYSTIRSINLLQNNKILAGGYSFNGSNIVTTQVRYVNTTLGVLDLNTNKNSFLIYPNPIETNATFEYTLQNEENISIDIIDLQGKLVKSIIKNQKQSPGNYSQNVNLDLITSGNYFLKFSSNTGSQTIKIIKK